MKLFFCLALLFSMCSCSLDKHLNDMDAKMAGVQISAQDMDKSLEMTQHDTAAMMAYMKEAITVLQGLAEQATAEPASQAISEQPVTSAQQQSVYNLDLSQKTVPQLTGLRNELKRAVQAKSLLKETIPDILALVSSLNVRAPDQTTDPAKSALIEDISSLLLQLGDGK